jgi:integrase
LRPIVIAALDTGMRRGELLSLKWGNVDFEHGLINIQAFNTKTMTERQVSMTGRLSQALNALYEQSTKDPERSVFGILSNVKRSFTAARMAAGLLTRINKKHFARAFDGCPQHGFHTGRNQPWSLPGISWLLVFSGQGTSGHFFRPAKTLRSNYFAFDIP